MGSRAQYVVVKNGAWRRYTSRWGANRLVGDLLAGPAAATRCLRAIDETDTWLDDVWCEGAALVDHDRRVLLWYCFLDSWADHLAARRVLTRTWPGWEVRFAHAGLGELTHHLGLGRDLVRPAGWFEAQEPFWYSEEESTEPWSVLSLRLADGQVAAWGSGGEVIEQLACGSGLIDLLLRAAPTPRPTAMPYGGVHFDPEARSVEAWAVETVVGIDAWPLPGWEGWTLDFHGDDHSGQAALLPEDFQLPQPSLGPALRQLRDRLGTPPPDPGPLLARALSVAGPEGTTVAMSPGALVPHPSADPAPGELARLHQVLAGLVAEAEGA
jgi:hypothetical protein